LGAIAAGVVCAAAIMGAVSTMGYKGAAVVAAVLIGGLLAQVSLPH
jgi:hypothetical protein